MPTLLPVLALWVLVESNQDRIWSTPVTPSSSFIPGRDDVLAALQLHQEELLMLLQEHEHKQEPPLVKPMMRTERQEPLQKAGQKVKTFESHSPPDPNDGSQSKLKPIGKNAAGQNHGHISPAGEVETSQSALDHPLVPFGNSGTGGAARGTQPRTSSVYFVQEVLPYWLLLLLLLILLWFIWWLWRRKKAEQENADATAAVERFAMAVRARAERLERGRVDQRAEGIVKKLATKFALKSVFQMDLNEEEVHDGPLVEVTIVGAKFLNHLYDGRASGQVCHCEVRKRDRKPSSSGDPTGDDPEEQLPGLEKARTKQAEEPGRSIGNPVWNETFTFKRWAVGEPLEFNVVDVGLRGAQTEGKATIFSEQFYGRSYETSNEFDKMVKLSGHIDAKLHVKISVTMPQEPPPVIVEEEVEPSPAHSDDHPVTWCDLFTSSPLDEDSDEEPSAFFPKAMASSSTDNRLRSASDASPGFSLRSASDNRLPLGIQDSNKAKSVLAGGMSIRDYAASRNSQKLNEKPAEPLVKGPPKIILEKTQQRNARDILGGLMGMLANTSDRIVGTLGGEADDSQPSFLSDQIDAYLAPGSSTAKETSAVLDSMFDQLDVDSSGALEGSEFDDLVAELATFATKKMESGKNLKLNISVFRATGLASQRRKTLTNLFESNLPYVVGEVLRKGASASSAKTKFQTQPLADSVDPEWNGNNNEVHSIDPWTVGEALEFTVYSKGMIRNPVLGKVSIASEQFFTSDGFTGELFLAGSSTSKLHVGIKVVGKGPTSRDPPTVRAWVEERLEPYCAVKRICYKEELGPGMRAVADALQKCEDAVD